MFYLHNTVDKFDVCSANVCFFSFLFLLFYFRNKNNLVFRFSFIFQMLFTIVMFYLPKNLHFVGIHIYIII